VAESKFQELWDRFTHTIAKMYTSATQHRCIWPFYPCLFSQDPSRENVVRGVLNNRDGWVFIILHLNGNVKGGGYKTLQEISVTFECFVSSPSRVSSRTYLRRSTAAMTSMKMTGFKAKILLQTCKQPSE